MRWLLGETTAAIVTRRMAVFLLGLHAAITPAAATDGVQPICLPFASGFHAIRLEHLEAELADYEYENLRFFLTTSDGQAARAAGYVWVQRHIDLTKKPFHYTAIVPPDECGDCAAAIVVRHDGQPTLYRIRKTFYRFATPARSVAPPVDPSLKRRGKKSDSQKYVATTSS